MFALIWSVGVTTIGTGRVQFDAYLRQIMMSTGVTIPFPKQGLVYDYKFLVEKSMWVLWMSDQDPFAYNAQLTFNECVVRDFFFFLFFCLNLYQKLSS